MENTNLFVESGPENSKRIAHTVMQLASKRFRDTGRPLICSPRGFRDIGVRTVMQLAHGFRDVGHPLIYSIVCSVCTHRHAACTELPADEALLRAVAVDAGQLAGGLRGARL